VTPAPLVVRSDRDGLAVLTLNRPDRLNALTFDLFRQLAEHVDALGRSTRTVGCVLVRGAGRAFSTGHDLDDLTGDAEQSERLRFEGRTIERLGELPQPVVAAVHGPCYTGGLELALAADIVLAAEGARFADTHAKFALTPVWGLSQRLPRRVGASKALELMFTGRAVPGAEAARIGLADAVFADDEFDDSVARFTATVLANSWHTHRAAKRLVRLADQVPLWAGLAHEAYRSEGVGPDFAERVAAFTRH
jgi:enoyl-CoA hydratase/carnithine racemase